jgi:hypothetical protein
MRPPSIFAGVFIALLAVPALAQTPPDGTPTRIRGTIEQRDGQTLVVRSREGQSLPVTLNKDFTVVGVVAAKLADIKVGDFVGAAAVKGADGKFHALEVLILPEAARGSNEGHYPWDLTPDSTMTNATVAEVVDAPQGRLLKLKHKDGATEIEVPADAPVVTFSPGDPSLLVAGTAVMVPALKKSDGSFTAGRVLAGKNGIKPPM